jgi:hypothetical protein
MHARLLPLLALAAALVPAAAAQAHPVDVPGAIGAKLDRVAAKTNVPILLPQTIDLDIDVDTPVYSSGYGRKRAWGFTLQGTRRCGANACSFAWFSARRAKRLGVPVNTRLVQGIKAHFKPLSCGASCSPPAITWLVNGRRYEIQAKTVDGSKQTFVDLANAALAGGGRV